MKKTFTLLMVFCLLVNYLAAQVSEGGIPYSLSTTYKTGIAIPVEELPTFEIEPLLAEDEINERSGAILYRFAKIMDVDYGLDNSGVWQTLDNGDRLWLLCIKTSGAYTTQVFFDQYLLPEGASIYVYSKSHNHILGAFTASNNKDFAQLAIAPVKGDEVVIEYRQPANNTTPPLLHIGQIGHGYRETLNPTDDNFGRAERCNRDINCAEGADWQREKHSVCRIIFKLNNQSYLCSGALINNARRDGTPYFLTANHCIPTYQEAETAIFYFNYESPTCNGADGTTNQTVSGATIVSTTNRLDFCLLKLAEVPPVAYKPYYSGWNVSKEPAKTAVAIHHPLGDVKKMSFYKKPPETADFIYQWDFDDSTHWYIPKWTLGITQGGSSGSPLYDENHRIIGDLTGGSTIANCTSADAFYSKMSEAWAKYTLENNNLKHWLDPDNSGITFLDGYDPNNSSIETAWRNALRINVFPNPTRGTISIGCDEFNVQALRISVYNITGTCVYTYNNRYTAFPVELVLPNLTDGIYYIRIVADDKIGGSTFNLIK